MKITKERVEQILPSNIKETTLLTDNTKNVLAMMMHSLSITKGAQESGVLVISNNRLRALLEMNRDYMLNSIRELEEYELVTRVVGKTRTEGKPSMASEYHFNWENIFNKPLKKKTSEELFSKFFKSSGTLSGTAITTTITTTNTITNTTANTTTTSTANTNASSTTNSTTTTSSTTSTTDKETTKPRETRTEERVEETKSNTNTSTCDCEAFRTNVLAEFEKCNSEEDLIVTKAELTSNLNSKRIGYSRAFWNRCASTIESICKQRQLELSSDSVAADLELPFDRQSKCNREQYKKN